MKPDASGFLVAPRPVPIRNRPIAGCLSVRLPGLAPADCNFTPRLSETRRPANLLFEGRRNYY